MRKPHHNKTGANQQKENDPSEFFNRKHVLLLYSDVWPIPREIQTQQESSTRIVNVHDANANCASLAWYPLLGAFLGVMQ